MSGPAAISALIAEDESLMAERLVRLLGTAWPDLAIAGVAVNGDDALALYARDPVDVLFLDIRMPGRTGLEVAECVLPGPQVVFTTAYDEHAVAAFEAGAIDYLLKPVGAARLAATVERVRQRLAAPGATRLSEVRRLVAALALTGPKPAAPLTWLRCSVGETVRLVRVADVLYFASDTKYTRVVMATGDAHVRLSLRDLLDALDPASFWQIHRGTVVNVEAIDRVVRDGPERLQVLLRGRAERLVVSRGYVQLFRRD